MKNNPDDRSDNAKKIKNNINSTAHNIELAKEMIAKTDDPNTKRDLEEKNKRREIAIDGLRNELKDETGWENGNKK